MTDDTTDTTDSIVDRATDSGDSTGRTIGRWLMAPPLFIWAVIVGSMYGILGKVPKRTAVYRKMIRLGYKGLYKKTNAHLVVNTIYGDGELVPRVAEIDDETGNLITANDEEWTVANGIHEVRIGNAPVVTGVADHHELVDHIGARTAECYDIGPSRYQTVEDDGEGVMPVAEDGAEMAIADGSGAVIPKQSLTFDDKWLDWSNPDEANDGMIVSMKKHYQLHHDRAGSEEMENQEKRGILAAKDPKSDTKQALIMVALALGGVCLGLFGPSLAQSIAGGGGGGPAIPITITATLGALI